jgi:2-oxoglutarate dehydrogenase E1 component
MGSSTPDLSVNAWNADYLDELYARWRSDPASVDPQWQGFFRGFELGRSEAPGAPSAPRAPVGVVDAAHTKQGHVDSLIFHYRDLGHFAAKLDPLGTDRPALPELRLDSFGLTPVDLDQRFDPGDLPLPNPSLLRDIVELLEATYCRHVGVEFMHIQDEQQRLWLQERMERARNRPDLSAEQKVRVLRELCEADALESFLNLRYRGQKRFSLEGGESLNCMLNEIIELCPGQGVRELTIGMAHRGRLNVLVNIMEKTYDQLFTEFEEAWVEDFIEGGGDVKYHRGYSHDKLTVSGETVRLTLSPNPSHLEFVNPVVLGRARAKQRVRRDIERRQCVPILIHGDAAFPAQGIVAETLNLTGLDGYTVGGAVHLVINNQIGFTTMPRDAHSGTYCTDIAKMVEAPIFHVNGDDPEACTFAAILAFEFRQRFRNDVVIDMWCFRKYGHNEGDEPSFTQPLMYERIRKHQPVVKLYSQQLIREGSLDQAQFAQMTADLKARMEESQSRTKSKPVPTTVSAFQSTWAGLTEEYSDDPIETGVDRAALEKVSRALGTVPEGFLPHRKLKKLVEYRGSCITEDQPIDWGAGEMLAYGSLLLEGHAVRLTGQDVERGTFSHRHAVLHDQKSGAFHEQLNCIEDGQARFCIHNSPLSENACVAFEYGYSLGDPKMLVIWEAQFGDFANGAQVIFDQFIASAEAKWKRFTGLTVFLPHGYEGAGPEHSSARLERFLTLCARNNMQVVYPTTPAQHFHMLRRQMKRSFRKPLVVMTPKSLLRHPKATSTVADLVEDRFHHMLDDPSVKNPKRISRLILCSGKVYYDLVAHREQAQRDDVAVARIEQLYPLRIASLEKVLRRYPKAEVVWVQEEPKNMGAWRFIEDKLREELELDLRYIGRVENATPAVASMKMHKQEQEKIMIEAIGIAESGQSKKKKKEDRAA